MKKQNVPVMKSNGWSSGVRNTRHGGCEENYEWLERKIGNLLWAMILLATIYITIFVWGHWREIGKAVMCSFIR